MTPLARPMPTVWVLCGFPNFPSKKSLLISNDRLRRLSDDQRRLNRPKDLAIQRQEIMAIERM